MTNTHCKICLFADKASESECCEFGIIDDIKTIKNLEVIDDYWYIKNYRCFYGFSKALYESHKNDFVNIDIKNHIVDQAKISYYLILDMREISDDILPKIIDQINELNIRPKSISFIFRTGYEGSMHPKISVLNNNLSKDIKWKVHAFLENISFNECANIAGETNVQESACSLVMFIDASKNHDINSMVNYAQYSYRVLQDDAIVIVKDHALFDGMIMPVSLFKNMINVVGRDTIKSMSMIPNLTIKKYEAET